MAKDRTVVQKLQAVWAVYELKVNQSVSQAMLTLAATLAPAAVAM
jgi:hypothetical protein